MAHIYGATTSNQAHGTQDSTFNIPPSSQFCHHTDFPDLKTVPYWDLFRNFKPSASAYLILSIILSLVQGIMLPFCTVVFGYVIDSFYGMYQPSDSTTYTLVTNIISSLLETGPILLFLSFIAFAVSSI